jgi:WD40 repeat protein
MRGVLLCAVLVVSPPAKASADEVLPFGATVRLGAGPMRVDFALQQLVVSPNGKFVAAGTAGRPALYVWDAETAKRLLVKRFDAIQSLCFSSDSQTLHLLGGDARQKPKWKRWNVADWSELPDGKLEESGEPRRPYFVEAGMRFRWQRSPTAPEENQIVDYATGKAVLTLPRTDFFNAQYSRDGDIAVFHAGNNAFKEGGLQVWNFKLQELLIDIPDVHPTAFAVSADGQRMVTANVQMDGVYYWDLKTGKRIQEVFESFSMHRMLLAPRGDRLYLTGKRTATQGTSSYFCDLSKDAGPPRESSIGEGPFDAVCFSEDGNVLALSHSNSVKIWDWKTDRFRFDGETKAPGPIVNLAVSRDKRIIAASSLRQIVVYDVPAQKSVQTIDVVSQGPVRLSPDKQYVAASRANLPALVWSRAEPTKPLAFPAEISDKFVATTRLDGGGLARGQSDGLIELAGFEGGGELPRQKFHHCRGHLGPITGLAYATDGMSIISRGSDRTVRVWDAATGKPIRKMEAAATAGSFVALSAKNKIAAWLEEDILRLHDVTADKAIGAVPHVQFAAFSMQGTKLVVCGNAFVALVDTKTGKLTKRYDAEKKELLCAVFAPDDARIYASDKWGKVTVFDATSLELVGQLDVTRPGNVLRFSNDGQRLIVASPQLFVVWDLKADQSLAHIPARGSQAFAHINDGKRERIAMLTPSGTRSSVDAKTGERIGGDWTSSNTSELGDCVFTSRGELVSTTAGGARVWKLDTGENTDNLADGVFYGYSVALSSNERIAFGGEGISIWNFPERKLEVRIDPEPAGRDRKASTVALGFSPDGHRLASIDGHVRIFDAMTGRQLAYNEGASTRPGRVTPAFRTARQTLTFTSDNRLLVVTGELGAWPQYSRPEVLFVDTLTGQIAFKLDQAPDSTSCAVLVDDETLITGDREGEILLWDFGSLLADAFPPEDGPADEAWEKLANKDAGVAWKAVSSLAAKPAVALAKVQAWLDEKPELTERQLDDLVPGLNSSSEAEQAIALGRVFRAGDAVDSRLDALLKSELPDDLQKILLAMRQGLPLADQPDMLRPLRVVQLLERLDDTQSHKMLKRLATGRSWKLAKGEAKAALDRLLKR